MQLSKIKQTRLELNWDHVNYVMKYTVRDRPCVYIIRDKLGMAIRIGSSTFNLAYRLKNYAHFGRKYYKEIVQEGTQIIIFEMPELLHDRDQLKAQLVFLEKALSAVHQPRYNVELEIIGERMVPLKEHQPFVYQK